MFQSFLFFRFIIITFILTTTLYSVHADARDAKEYLEIEWTALMPGDDLEALLNAPDFFDEIEEGSRNDSLDMLITGDPEDPRTARYLQALGSMNIVEEYDQKRIRIPGFIVPLVSDEKQNITEFFIVPYFGACLHLPPPPPNQILHVKTDKKVRLNGLQDAFWFEGQVNIETTSNLLGKAAYSLRLENIRPYDE
jgi:hypothetical protein